MLFVVWVRIDSDILGWAISWKIWQIITTWKIIITHLPIHGIHFDLPLALKRGTNKKRNIQHLSNRDIDRSPEIWVLERINEVDGHGLILFISTWVDILIWREIEWFFQSAIPRLNYCAFRFRSILICSELVKDISHQSLHLPLLCSDISSEACRRWSGQKSGEWSMWIVYTFFR